jgi:hypothetical protein
MNEQELLAYNLSQGNIAYPAVFPDSFNQSWVSNPPIDYQTQLYNTPTVSSSQCAVGTMNISASWNYSVTWLTFQPTKVSIYATSGGNSVSNGFTDWVKNQVQYLSSGAWNINTTHLIVLQPTTSSVLWTISSFNTDWFTVNISTYTVSSAQFMYVAES